MRAITARGSDTVDRPDGLAQVGRAATRFRGGIAADDRRTCQDGACGAAGGRRWGRPSARACEALQGRYARRGNAVAGSTRESLPADHCPMLPVSIQYRPGQVDARAPGGCRTCPSCAPILCRVRSQAPPRRWTFAACVPHVCRAHDLHMAAVTGSIPVPPTNPSRHVAAPGAAAGQRVPTVTTAVDRIRSAPSCTNCRA